MAEGVGEWKLVASEERGKGTEFSEATGRAEAQEGGTDIDERGEPI